MNINKISILFLLSKAKRNVRGECPIKCRVTFRKERKEFSTGYFIADKNWNAKRQRAIGKGADNINSNLGLIKQKLEQVGLEYAVLKHHYSVEDIFLKYNGKGESSQKTLLSMFQLRISRMKNLIGIECEAATVKKYETVEKQVKGFIQWKYGKNDVLLEELKLNFINEFDFYLKTKLNQRQITANKTIQRLKTIIKIAIGEGYILSDPFILFKPKKADINLVYLTPEELELLEKHHFNQERLSRVRDLYVFSVYTGLGYNEAATLTKANIVKGFDDELWLDIVRKKTDKKVLIPLLPKAISILEKYSKISQMGKLRDNQLLLPVISNQKFNSYIKEIAEIVGINKRLTHHTARKTFASTVLLYNDVPIEVVSALLGHASIKVTQQHYARVANKTVSRHMITLKNKLTPNK